MNLRQKLLLSQLPLVAALTLVAAGSLYAATIFGAAPGKILHQNFRSFDAGRSMLHVVEQIDQQVVYAKLQGGPLDSGKLGVLEGDFEGDLELQRSNLTEDGERNATDELERLWDTYRAGVAEMGSATGPSRHGKFSLALRVAIERIVEINRNAMQRKSELARVEAERVGMLLTATALLAFVGAVLLSGVWIRNLVAPIRMLERAVLRMSAGDFEARIRSEGRDEISSLSNAFNEMATRIEEYRQSSIGELLEANSRLESVMDSLADAVIVFDLDGTPIASNRVVVALFGTDRPALGSFPEGLDDAVRTAFERVRRTGETFEPTNFEGAVEIPGIPLPRWVIVTATPVRIGGGVLGGVTIALRDVTRLRRIEGFKGDLVAAAAHELRTPLTSLRMAVHLCLEQAAGPLNDQQLDLLTTARQDCERLQGVVEELLEMARFEAGAARLETSPLNVSEVISDALSRHEGRARQQKKTISGVPGDRLVEIQGDLNRLGRVLDNLIENAFAHAGEAGRVSLGFERTTDGVLIYVDDSGPGIPVHLREQVFAKFFRVPGTSKQGSGLGLAIVADVVRAHGGKVGASQAPLGGARFWFELPFSPPFIEGLHGSNPSS